MLVTKSAIQNDTAMSLYLDLLKRCLMGTSHTATYRAEVRRHGRVDYLPATDEGRSRIEEGRDWPAFGETMIGQRRLDNLCCCVEDLLDRDVAGDFIEAGVWRGGAAIFLKALLTVFHDNERTVWLADSFEGLPMPNAVGYPADTGSGYHEIPFLAVPAEEVIANFRRYGLYDDRVRLVRGYFKDTLPKLADETWSLVRLDGDMYESTWDGLVHLYPRLSVGGYLIIDDFGCCPPCRQAVEDYRARHKIDDPIESIDWTGVYWRKTQ